MAALTLTKNPTSTRNIWGTPRSDIDPTEYCQDCEKAIEHGHFYTCPTRA